jgi:hypothetical protein
MGPKPSPAQREKACSIPGLTLVENDCALEWMENPWDDLEQAGAWLMKLEASHKPDLVHLNQYAHGTLPWRAPLIMTGHSCVLSWWHSVHGCEAPESWARYKRHVGSGVRAADVVTAPSRTMLTALQKHYGPLPRSRVLYNGRDGRRFGRAAKQNIVISMGRMWDEAKNLRALDDACAKVPWQTCFIGPTVGPGGAQIVAKHATALGALSEDEVPSGFRVPPFSAPPRCTSPLVSPSSKRPSAAVRWYFRTSPLSGRSGTTPPCS